MTVAGIREFEGTDFLIEELSTGLFASGFGWLGDGRAFAFRVHRGQLDLEIYRLRLAGPVPLPEDVVAAVRRPVCGVDLDDERSLSAVVRDAIAAATR